MSKNSQPSTRIPRGIRNNNPLNIRIGNTWLGEVPFPTESEFEQFVNILYGLRAAFCILRRYIRRYQSNTIRKIVSRWAPRVENDTDLYCGFVAQRCNVNPDAVVNYLDEELMVNIVRAMAKFECGEEISADIIRRAYNMA